MSDELKPPSIDSGDFRKLLEAWASTEIYPESGHEPYDALIAHIDTWAASSAGAAAAKGAIERAAILCDEMEQHYSDYKDTAQLNGDVDLAIAASGEPRACRFLAERIRALAAAPTPGKEGA